MELRLFSYRLRGRWLVSARCLLVAAVKLKLAPLIRRCLSRYDDNFGPLTRSQYEALAAIEDNPEASQHRLCAITGIDRSTMSEMLIRLEKMEFILRGRIGTDTRALAAQLTPDGRAELARSHRIARKAEAVLLKPLKVPERKRLTEFLARMAETPQ